MLLAENSTITTCLPPTRTKPESEGELRLLVKEKAAEGNYSEAIALLTCLLEVDPHSAANYNNRGLMYQRNGQFSEAIADLTRALELNPLLDAAYNNRANCYAAVGDSAAALRDYEIALDLNPGNLNARINQGITFRDIGIYELAVENFDIALVIGRKLKARIYGERGFTYHLWGDWNYAIADYKRSLALLPSSSSYFQQVQTWLDLLEHPESN